MASFTLPPIHDSTDGGWGPSTSTIPDQFKFKDIPYAPYAKSDKLGRFADWNDLTTDSRQGQGHGGGGGGGERGERGERGPGGIGGGPGGINQQTRLGPGGAAGGRRREGVQAFGSGTANAFAYFHVEDESSFSLVDNKAAPPRRGVGFSRGRGGAVRGGPGGQYSNVRGGAVGRGGGRGGVFQRTNQRGGFNQRRGWRDWDKNYRARESSIVISPTWAMLEEVEFHRLSKLRLEVDEPEELGSYGRLFAYDKSFDRVTTKAERPLQLVDRIKYNITTTDDPVIQQLVNEKAANIYTTDVILSAIMAAPRSIYPWDIVVIREGENLYFDKREGGPFDTVTVNENASDPPQDPLPPNPNNPNEKPTVPETAAINTATSLSLESTYINQNFGFQSTTETGPPAPVDLANPNPFYGPEETEPLASCGYRYRLFDLGVTEDEDYRLCVRTEADAYVPGMGDPQAGQGLVTIRALNEFDSRSPGAGGAPDWRTKLDSQRGAVVTTEMKNNSCKLARWAVQSILAGAEVMKIGYISRANARDNTRHVILSTASVRPSDFAAQLNISLANGWGIVRAVLQMCKKLPEGKYILLKDPNKPVLRLYSVPATEGDLYDEEGEEEEQQ